MRNACKWPAVLTALFLVGSAYAEMKDEPADFRGVRWGEPFDIASAQMTILRDEGAVKYYKRRGDTLKFGHVDAVKIAFRYYKDQFSSGVVQTYGGANQKALLATLAGMHGDPLQPRKKFQQYFWDGEKVFIVLTCEINSYCVVEINSKEVIQREQAETGLVTPVQRKDDD
jgi:hypothetical protein